MRKKIVPILRMLALSCSFLPEDSIAQFSPDTTILNKSVANAIELYHSSQGGQAPIYNGTEHIRYPASIEGFAYYLSNEWQKGMVNYDGILYTDVFMLYDALKDVLIIQHPNRIALIPQVAKVKGFSFPGHVFVRMEKTATPSLKTGLYEQYTRGAIQVVVKREKIIEEKVNGVQLERKFIQHDRYYIVKDDVYYTINSEKDILKVLKENRNEIRQYLSDNNLRFKTDPDAAILQSVEYFNQLSHH